MPSERKKTTDKGDLLRPLKGTDTVTGSDAALRRQVIDAILSIARNYGYDEMSTPMLYDRSLLTFKFDEGAELADEIYPVTDRGGRTLGLRYDLTVPFARYVAQNAKSLTLPYKRAEIGEVFRDGPVKNGRARQFTQCDIDVVGDADPAITAYEQISLMVEVFDRLGLGDAKVLYSSRKLAEGIALYNKARKEDVGTIIRVMDKKGKISDDELSSALIDTGLPEEFLSSFNEMLEMDSDRLSSLRSDIGGSIEEARDGRYDMTQNGTDERDALSEWLDGLEMLASGIDEILALDALISCDERLRSRCVLDPSLVRGQDYYTGIVFEAFCLGFPSSVAGGGRYETMIADLAGAKEGDEGRYSASGVSFGLVPIMYVLRERARANAEEAGERGEAPSPVRDKGLAVLCVDEADVPYALRLANALRSRIRCEVDASARSVSKKMKAADKAGFAYTLVLGENEREGADKGLAMYDIKNMSNGKTLRFTAGALELLDEDDLARLTGDETAVDGDTAPDVRAGALVDETQ